MSQEIKNLEPKKVWEYFYQLTQIPRPSKHEKAVVEFMQNFGKSLNLETYVDSVGNVIIRKPATKGMENRKGIILQAHLDMVPQANSNIQHNFTKDPIDAYIDGEWVTARDTTLGADNGIGVAAIMAILEDHNIQHGPIEALFTVDEETGMTGAFNLKPDVLKGDILINLDSEDEGELYVGCAGGEDALATFLAKYENAPTDFYWLTLAVKGLKGGHANKILFRILRELTDRFGIRIASIEGGSLRNAIPREAFATFGFSPNHTESVKQHIKQLSEIIKTELKGTEPTLCIEEFSSPKAEQILDITIQNNLINAVLACPNGVIRMSDSMPGLVETSNNLAIVKSEKNRILVQCLMRSSVDTARKALAMDIKAVFDLAQAKIEFKGGYPGWRPNMESPILKTMQETYQRMFGKTPEIKAVHAGLECGILGGIYPHWDMISCGPTIRYPHSPDEKVKIDTIQRFYDFLIETLKSAPTK